jgi:hypothetical protein
MDDLLTIIYAGRKLADDYALSTLSPNTTIHIVHTICSNFEISKKIHNILEEKQNFICKYSKQQIYASPNSPTNPRNQVCLYNKKNTKVPNTKIPNLVQICPPEKIINPGTGRCVKKNGVTGKQLINNSNNGVTGKRIINNSNKTNIVKICPPEKIINPGTGRCVKKNGVTGKQLLEK